MMWLARFFLLYLSYSHAALDISITPKYLSTISKKVSGKSPNTYILTALLYKSIHQNLPA